MNALLAALLYLQFPMVAFQQVIDTVKVKLDEADPDCKLPFIQLLPNRAKDVVDC